MSLPAEIQNYRNRQNANRGTLLPDIIYRWENHIVPSNLYSLGEEGAYAYLKRRRLSEDNLVQLAIQSEAAGFTDMANGFWKKAYEASNKKNKLTSKSKSLQVFISHASEDETAVLLLASRLRDDGFDPWLSEEQLIPGQNWELEIENALRKSDVILLCFSEKSISKEGFVQREFKRAMKYQEEKPEGVIFTIPVRLDKAEVPFSYRQLQWVDFPANYKQLIVALENRKRQLSLNRL